MNYIVKPGDSLSKIARDMLGDKMLWVELAKLNKISRPDKIYPGQILNLDVTKRTVIDITSGTPKIITDTEVLPLKTQSNITGWVVGLSVTAIAVAVYSKSKKKKTKYN